jgi:zinc finger BED domain-containing protein 1 (E3 SUMO-protein ligase ZBED1)
MRYHLRSEHPSLYAKLIRTSTQSKRQREEEMEEVERAEQEAEVQDHCTPKKKRVCRKLAESPDEQGNTIDRYRKFASSDRRQLDYDMWTTEFLVAGSHPFALVDSDHFRQYMAKLCPRVQVKSASTFAKNKVPRLHDAMRAELINTLMEQLAGTSGISFTSDMWTSRNRQSFLSITIHYINADFELKRYSLNCIPFRGAHTADRISRALDAEIGKVPVKRGSRLAAVHDAAPNMKAGVRKSSFGLKSYICTDHRLQTVLKKAFNAPEADLANNILKKAVALSSLMHRSSKACEMVEEESDCLGVPYVVVIAPCETRWNSKYLMLKSINTIAPALVSLQEKGTDLGEKLELFTDSEMEMMKWMEKVLAKFDEATKIWSADKNPTMQEVIPTLMTLKWNLRRWKEVVDNLVIPGLCQALLQELDKAWPDCGSTELPPRMCHFLHPHWRGLFLKEFGKFDSTVKELIDGHPSTNEFKSKPTSTPSRRAEESSDFFASLADDGEVDPLDAMANALSDSHGETAVEKPPMELEIATYLGKPKPTRNVNILQWWKDQTSSLPLLAEEVQKYLCIPASSTASERMFSASGNIVTEERHNLDAKTTQMLTFCQQNWRDLKCHGWLVDTELRDLATGAGAVEHDIPSQADLAEAGASGTSSGKSRSGQSSQSAQVPIDSDSD